MFPQSFLFLFQWKDNVSWGGNFAKWNEEPVSKTTQKFVVQSLKSCPTLCKPMDCSTLGFPSFTVSWSLLRFIFTKSMMISNHLILCRPLLLLSSGFPSIRVFSDELAFHIRWPKYCPGASTSVFPMNIQSLFPLGFTGLISLWFKGLSRVFSSTQNFNTIYLA